MYILIGSRLRATVSIIHVDIDFLNKLLSTRYAYAFLVLLYRLNPQL